jgi:hypothetical protein
MSPNANAPDSNSDSWASPAPIGLVRQLAKETQELSERIAEISRENTCEHRSLHRDIADLSRRTDDSFTELRKTMWHGALGLLLTTLGGTVWIVVTIIMKSH